MKRSAALAPLSRDHQHALDVALRLRRAEAGTAIPALEAFREFFSREGRRHFAIEEEFLLGALPADDAEWAAAVQRVRDDHEAIRGAADAAATDETVGAARALGQRLNDHVRFEERILFPMLEGSLTPEALQRLGEAVERAESEPS